MSPHGQNGIHAPTAEGPLAPYPNFGTLAIHAGQGPDPATAAVTLPISLSTTFAQSSPGVHKGYEYSRSGNPTRDAYENCVAALENGKYAISFSSGLAAISTIVQLLPHGSEIVSMNDVYGGTHRTFSKVVQETQKIKTTFVDATDLGALKGALSAETKMVWLETPTNPTLKIIDLKGAVEVVRAFNKDIIIVVDNTFLSSYFQRPLDFGVDIVMHSITKYMNGHSDVVQGMAVSNDEKLSERLRFLQNALGGIPGPFDAWLANRGLKTLHLRMRQHQENAFAVARALEASDGVEDVIYPGLPSHPGHEIAKRQQTGFGGMVSFRIKGGLEEAKRFLENVKVFTLAESLGAVESLAELPAVMTHAGIPHEERQKSGVTDNLIRLSCGIEETEDLVADVLQAVKAAHSK
eukprot:Clim_evm42s235 gene=Clim_evmTU42s235